MTRMISKLKINNLRVRGDTWTGPSGTQTTEWRVFHLFFKLRNPPGMFAQPQGGVTIEWAGLPQHFQHLTKSTPVYKDCWPSSHTSVMTCISGEPPLTLPELATHPPDQSAEAGGTGAAPLTTMSSLSFCWWCLQITWNWEGKCALSLRI